MPKEPHLHVFGFPVRFEVWFWLTAAFIGIRYSQHLGYGLLFLSLLTLSILVHELGHAFAYRHYGTESSITMQGLGGCTTAVDARHLHSKQRIVVSGAGVAAEMALLGGPAWILMQVWSPGGWTGLILFWLFWINAIWALINLVPVWPLDGGHIMDDVIFLMTGEHKRQFVHQVSIAMSVVMIVFFLSRGLTFGAILFGYKIFINLGLLGLVGPGRGSGYIDRNGGLQEVARPVKAKPLSTKGAIRSGYAFLGTGSTTEAMETAAVAVELSSARDETARRDAAEIIAWSWLRQHRPDQANEVFDSIANPTQSLSAAIRIENGDDHGGVLELARAIQVEGSHPASQEAILYTVRSGHVAMLVVALLDEDTALSKGHVVRIEALLDQLNETPRGPG